MGHPVRIHSHLYSNISRFSIIYKSVDILRKGNSPSLIFSLAAAEEGDLRCAGQRAATAREFKYSKHFQSYRSYSSDDAMLNRF